MVVVQILVVFIWSNSFMASKGQIPVVVNTWPWPRATDAGNLIICVVIKRDNRKWDFLYAKVASKYNAINSYFTLRDIFARILVAMLWYIK